MIKSFLDSEDWKEIKLYLVSELADKPLDIKTEGKTAEQIAIEVRSSQIASEKIVKVIRKLERKATQERKQAQPFR